jgi:hypothetical protein
VSDVPEPVFGAPPADGNALQEQLAKQVSDTFREIHKAIKKMAFNRHDPAKFQDYFEQAFGMFSQVLANGHLDLKLEVSTLVWGSFDVLEDDSRENNIVYPLWQLGVRLLTFRPGLTLQELMRFYSVLVGMTARDASIDLLTALWKEDFVHIEWVVMTDFDLIEDDGKAEVEVEVEKVLNYLNKSLMTGKGEGVSFARVSVDDLNLKLNDLQTIRQTRLAGDIATDEEKQTFFDDLKRDEEFLLEKICTILFQVMEIPASKAEFEDQRAALEQVLDGLILQGKFAVIEKVLETLDRYATRRDLSNENRELARACHEDMTRLMHEAHRVKAVATALNTGATRDIVGVKHYLERLGPSATVLVLDLLDSLNNPAYRRAVAEVLVDTGRHGVQLYAVRLKSANSQLAKELLFIIDRIDPPDKLKMFAGILEHENPTLRMEGLTAIGHTKTQQCFDIIKRVFDEHDVPQMRAHAARLMATYPPEWATKSFMDVVREPEFDERPIGERRAIYAGLARLDHEDARRFIQSIFADKGSLLARKKIDEKKAMVLNALQTVPSIPTIQLLAVIAQDTKNNSKEICETAKQAALQMRTKMLGSGA